jgi:hypothetical protein
VIHCLKVVSWRTWPSSSQILSRWWLLITRQLPTVGTEVGHFFRSGCLSFCCSDKFFFRILADNAIPISDWWGTQSNTNDTALLDLVPFLEALKSVEDVRSILSLKDRPSFWISRRDVAYESACACAQTRFIMQQWLRTQTACSCCVVSPKRFLSFLFDFFFSPIYPLSLSRFLISLFRVANRFCILLRYDFCR